MMSRQLPQYLFVCLTFVIATGCGEDPPADESDTGLTDAETGIQDTEADVESDTGQDVEPDVCEPVTCEEAGVQCGEVDDGCGGTLDCGGCEGNATCGEVAPNMCNCAPESDETFCERLGKTCGRVTAEDNCGFERTAVCGSCGPADECGSDNTCECKPKTDVALCSENDLACGTETVDGRCGQREVECGECSGQPGERCSGNQCICKPFGCGDVSGECGVYPDGCGGQITCEGGCDDALLTAGGYHTCYRPSGSQDLMCWGWNDYGQIGTGSAGTDRYNTPQKVVTKFPDLYTLTAGEDYTCVVDGNEAKCWGANYYGQALGSETDAFGNDLDEVLLPRNPKVPGVGINQIDAGTRHACAINTAGELYCWGANLLDGRGEGSLVAGPANPKDPSNPAVEPRQYTLGQSNQVADVDAGLGHSCGEARDGSLWCWGIGFFGALGAGPGYFNTRYTPPVEVSGFDNGFIQVESGGLDQSKGPNRGSYYNDFSCAIDTSSAAKCWGSDAFNGELGNGKNNRSEPSPVQVKGLAGDVRDLALGGTHACAIQNSEVWCWGGNEYGQIGNGKSGDDEQENVPVKIAMPNGADARDVEAGFYHTCAVLGTDELACWGRNADGQLGDGSFDDSSVPKVVYP